MKLTILIGAILWPLLAYGQLELLPDESPAAAFAGRPTTIKAVIHNPTDAPVELEASNRLFQATSATLVPLGDAQPWKKLHVLPKQTVLETFAVTFPEVRAATHFRIQWIGIGRTEVSVFPPNMLKQLGTLAGEKPLAVFDPDGKLKPLLKQVGVEFADYEQETAASRLAIVWWSHSTLPESILSRVKKGMAAVWIHPEKTSVAYAVRVEEGTVVVVPRKTMTALADSPLTQQTLVRFAELALEPAAWQLPTDNQPTERN